MENYNNTEDIIQSKLESIPNIDGKPLTLNDILSWMDKLVEVSKNDENLHNI